VNKTYLILALCFLSMSNATAHGSKNELKAFSEARAKLRAGLENHDGLAISDAERKLNGLCLDGFGPACHVLGSYYLSLRQVEKARPILTAGCEKKDERACVELADYFAKRKMPAERTAWLKDACEKSELARPCRLLRDALLVQQLATPTPTPSTMKRND
jgi:hypothetical protein